MRGSALKMGTPFEFSGPCQGLCTTDRPQIIGVFPTPVGVQAVKGKFRQIYTNLNKINHE
jgi:hypothetical protein